MPSLKTSLTWSVVFVAMLFAAMVCADPARHAVHAAETVAVAQSPPKVVDLDGQSRSLWKDGQRNIVVVVFTRSDCPVSNRYAPAVRELCEKYHPRGVEFYLVYVDPAEQPEAIRNHLKEFAYPCEGLRDPKHELVAFTGATITPEAVVFDADRQLVYRGRIDDKNAEFGKMKSVATEHDLADAIEATLAGRQVKAPVTTAVGCFIGDLK